MKVLTQISLLHRITGGMERRNESNSRFRALVSHRLDEMGDYITREDGNAFFEPVQLFKHALARHSARREETVRLDLAVGNQIASHSDLLNRSPTVSEYGTFYSDY